MHRHSDSEPTGDCVHELARILAVGVLRVRQLRIFSEGRHESAPKFAEVGLDDCEKTVLSGQRGQEAKRSSRPGVGTTSPALTTTTL